MKKLYFFSLSWEFCWAQTPKPYNFRLKNVWVLLLTIIWIYIYMKMRKIWVSDLLALSEIAWFSQKMSLNVSIIVELGHFQKDLVKNTRKRGPSGKHFGAFSSIYSQTTFWMENLTQRWTQSGPLFQRSGHFQFSKLAGKSSPLTLFAHLWLWLNMH